MFIPSYKKPGGGGSYTPPTWSDGTDEEIVEALQKHYAGEIDLHDYWSVGDERVVSLTNIPQGYTTFETQPDQDIILVISEVGGKELSHYPDTECVFQVDFKAPLSSPGIVDSSAVSRWDSSKRCKWLNSDNRLLSAFPSTLQPIFKWFDITTQGIDDEAKFSLRAEIEIFGSVKYATNGASEGSQIEWYKTSANRTHNSRLRSYANSGNYQFCQIYNNKPSYNSYNSTAWLVPFGVI